MESMRVSELLAALDEFRGNLIEHRELWGIRTGTAADFDKARANFEQAWQVFLPKRTEADFQAWRVLAIGAGAAIGGGRSAKALQ